jgi:hypothetical protein
MGGTRAVVTATHNRNTRSTAAIGSRPPAPAGSHVKITRFVPPLSIIDDAQRNHG